MTKKIYLTVLALLVASFGLFAQNPQVKIGNVTSGPGEILVPLEMLGFTAAVNSFTFKITANSSLLEFVELTNKVGFTGPNYQAYQNGNTLSIVYFDIGPGYQPNGKIFDMKFNYTGAANTTLTFQAIGNEVTSGIFPVPNITYINGTITTTQPIPDPVVKVGNVVAAPGAVNIPVEMLNFTQNINSITFKIDIPNNLLQYVDLQNIASGFNSGTWQAFHTGNMLNIQWFTTGSGFTPSGHVFDIRLNYLGGFNTELTWAPGNEVTYGSTPVANISYIKGSVTQVPAVGTVTVGSATVPTGNSVSLPVSFNGAGLNGVSAFTLFMQYDASKLVFAGTSNSVSPDLIVNQSAGTINMAWQGAPQNFSSATIINLNFIYNGIAPAHLSFLPGSEVNNASANPLPVSYVNGVVSPQVSNSVLKIADVSGFAGQTVNVPVNATEIGTVGALDIIINFDNTKATLASYTTNQLSGWVVNQTASQIYLQWQNIAGATINDGALLTLHFQYHGGGTLPIVFGNGTEVTGTNGLPKSVNFNNGSITQDFSNSQAVIGTVVSCTQNTALVPVSLNNIGLVTSFTFPIGFNTSVLTYVELQNVNPLLVGLQVNQTGNVINIAWESTTPRNLDGKLFDMVYSYLGMVSPVTFNAGSEITGVGATVLPVTFVNGSVDCNIDTRVLTLNKTGNGFIVVKDGSTILTPDANTTNQYTVFYGKVLTLEATGDLGWEFLNWTGAVTNVTTAITSVNMINNLTVTGNFGMIDYTLTLNVNPAAGGTVTGAGVYNFGNQVSVNASPNTGYEFVNWTNLAGDVVSTQPANVIPMPASNLTLIANFALVDYTLTLNVNPAAGGTVTGAGTYNFGNQVSVNATPNTGYAFVNWTNLAGDVVSTQPANVIPMPASDLTLIANFALIDYTLTLNVNPAAGGTVTGAGTYNFGNQVSVNASPNTGYEFVNWTNLAGDVVSTQPANVIPMPASDLTLIANFALVDYTLTLNVNPAAGGTVTGAGTYNFGNQVSVNASPNTGYEFVNWTNLAGDVVSTQPANVISMPASNLTLIANFVLVDYTLTLNVNPAAGGTVTGAGTYNFGAQIPVNAVPTTGYNFVNWTDATGAVVSTQPANVITMPASNLTLTANFVLAYVAPFPFAENFNAETFPPQYWNRYRQGTGATVREWVRSTAQNYPSGAGASAFHNYGPSTQTEDGWLITPKINIPAGGDDVELRFWNYNTFPTFYGKNSVLISTTDGTPGAAFTEVWTVASLPNPAAWAEYIVNLNAYKGQQIFIAFRYEGSDAHAWHLDNVTVDYAPALAPVIAVSPASLTQTLEVGQTGSKTVTVTNTGNAPLIYTLNVNQASAAYSIFDHLHNVKPEPVSNGQIGVAEQDLSGGTEGTSPMGVKFNEGTGRGTLFDNGPFVNAPGAGPNGSDLSQLHSGMTTLGPSINHGASIRVADDFTVTANWNVESFTFYAYQTSTTHPTPPVSTITGAYMKIWSGMPDAAGSVVVYGDMTVNALTSTAWTNVYRVGAAVNNQRPIMSIVCATPGLTLQPGTYYVEWSATGSIASGPWGVPVTINGETNTGNALQFTTTTNAWTPLEMGGTLTGYGLSFLVEGTATTPPVTWLTASPLGGTIAPGASETIQVNFDATQLEVGTYTGSLAFASNDLTNPTVTVPVTLNVEPSSICYPAPRNLTSTVAAQTVTLNWSAPNFGGGGGGGTVKLEEGFEGATFPPTGWAKLNPDNGTGWISLLAGTTPIPGWTGASVATAAPDGGTKMAFATWNTGGATANNQWLVTPQITLEAGDKLAFHMRYAFDSYADNVDIRISTASQNNPADFTTVVAALTFGTGSSTDWVLYEYNLTDFVAPGTPIYIGFREHVADNFNDGSAIMIDNVYVGPAPTLAAVAPSIGMVSAQRDYSYAVNTVPQIAGSVGVSELDANASTGAVVPGGVKYNTGNTRSEILFDNGPFVNNPGAGPGGSDLSQLHSGMTTFGPSINQVGSIRVADDFTVTDTWNVESFTFYAYQTSATHPTPPVSTITGAYMKIWSGMPDAAGSVVVYGDMTVNALTSSAWTNAYRVSGTAVNNQRPIMSIVCATPGLTLQPGTYYVEWAATGSIASGPWGVPVTINGETNTGNAIQFTTTTNAWVPLEMGGTLTGYGLSFLIEGTEAGGGGCTHGEHLGYNVYRNGTLIGNTVPSVRTFVDSNVPAGTHIYGVTAVYGAPYPGESDMITTEVTVVAPPAITLNPTSIYQYFLAVGNTATKQVNIANTGLSPLTWTATIQYTNESNAMPVPVPEGGATLQGTLDMSVVASNGGDPQGEDRSMVTLSYDGPNATGIGLQAGGTFSLAARYPSSMTTPYAGYKLKQVEIYINEVPTSAVLKVWGAGTTGSPGTLLREQNLTVVQGWNTINLANQLTLDGTDLWVGYTVTHAAGAFPAGMDAGPANANGDFISTDGTSWNKLSVLAATINRNWNIKAKLEPGVTYTWLMMSPPMSGTIAPGASTNRTLVLNSAGLTPARYTANVLFASNDPANPVKALPVVMDVVIGVNETDMSAINVYPVPAHSYLNLQLVEGIRLVRMFNYMGQVVIERSINGELSTTLNLDGMRSGAYTLQFISAEGKTYSRTVIINR